MQVRGFLNYRLK